MALTDQQATLVDLRQRSADPVEVRHPIQRKPQYELAAAGGPVESLFRRHQRLPRTDNAPQNVAQAGSGSGNRRVETLTGGYCLFTRQQPAVARAAHAYRMVTPGERPDLSQSARSFSPATSWRSDR